MTLKLEIISDHCGLAGVDAIFVFDETGGTIGRSLQNDWVLPDPDRFISGRHATVECEGGRYYLQDTSSNGIFINGDCEPLGKGNLRRLFSGDRLCFGDFEILVSIHADANEVSADDETDLNPTLADSLDIEKCRVADAPNGAQTTQPGASAPTPEVLSDLASKELIDGFARGLGIRPDDWDPATDPVEIMQNAGKMLREFLEGTSKLLASRAAMKNAFRLDETLILPQLNNALKLWSSTQDLVKQLLVGKQGEYLGPRDTVREACRDLLVHQEAFFEAMTEAINDFGQRFDPDELECEIEEAASASAWRKWLGGDSRWSEYRKLYPSLMKTGSGGFPQVCAEAFNEAYDRFIAESRQRESNDGFRPAVFSESGSAEGVAVPPASNDDQVTATETDVVDQAAVEQPDSQLKA